MEITTILWREWLFLKRRFWRVTFSQMVSPLLYFVTFGMGLGRVMEMDGRPYLYYLIPGLLAMTTMRNSYTSVSTRISVMRLHEKSFECYLYSPTRMYLLAMGHIFAGALRGMYSGVFIVLLGIVSGARLSMNGWLLTAVILNSLIFSALGFLAAMMMESHYDMNNFTNIVITPMSFSVSYTHLRAHETRPYHAAYSGNFSWRQRQLAVHGSSVPVCSGPYRVLRVGMLPGSKSIKTGIMERTIILRKID